MSNLIFPDDLYYNGNVPRYKLNFKGIAKKLAGDSAFKDIPESSKNKWIEISIISVGVLAGVLLMAHLLVSFMQRNTVLESRNSRNY